jgi:hypothetical protein
MSYTQVSISNYNATPPTDDGASGSTNTITWDKIKTKLGDPVNTAIASIDDNVASSCNSLDAAITSADSTLSSLQSTLSSYSGGSALNAPVGTAMFFTTTAAPTGWTKSSTHNDKAIRSVTGTASSGGSTAFTSVFTSRTISSSNMPSHTHSFSQTGASVTFNRLSWSYDVDTNTNNISGGGGSTAYQNVSQTSGTVAGSVTVSGTTSSAGSGTAIDFALQYVDCILATKN